MSLATRWSARTERLQGTESLGVQWFKLDLLRCPERAVVPNSLGV